MFKLLSSKSDCLTSREATEDLNGCRVGSGGGSGDEKRNWAEIKKKLLV